MSGSISNMGSGGPGGLEFRPERWRSRGLLPDTEGLVRRAPTSGEVIQRVAEHSRGVPPPKDLLQVTAAAARYALTRLDSAQQIAEEIRSDQSERRAAEFAEAASGGAVDRMEVAEALGA